MNRREILRMAGAGALITLTPEIAAPSGYRSGLIESADAPASAGDRVLIERASPALAQTPIVDLRTRLISYELTQETPLSEHRARYYQSGQVIVKGYAEVYCADMSREEKQYLLGGGEVGLLLPDECEVRRMVARVPQFTVREGAGDRGYVAFQFVAVGAVEYAWSRQ